MHVVYVVCFLTCVSGYQHFQTNLPNGDRVPDPSINNTLWAGVGHLNTNGGGLRNAFGKDFAANDYVSFLIFQKKINIS